MPLELDSRQRAMLQEMGVRVWLPSAEPPALPPAFAEPQPVAMVSEALPVNAFEKPSASPAPAAPRPAVSAPPARTTPPVVPTAAPVSVPLVATAEASELAQAAANCQACGLCAGRKNSTLQHAQTGIAQADWMVLSDPPDEAEDRMGQPLVGQAGLLLDNILKAVGASRSAVGAGGAYVSNVVKCRPPAGRVPQPSDLAQCAAFLEREIALVQPKVIIAMGRFALQRVLAEQPALATQPLGKLRGQVYRYQGIPVVLSYHPNVLLRTSADKAKAWADWCLAWDVVAQARM